METIYQPERILQIMKLSLIISHHNLQKDNIYGVKMILYCTHIHKKYVIWNAFCKRKEYQLVTNVNNSKIENASKVIFSH